MEDIALYIHIPFCKAKCYYCDFTSFSGKENLIEKYIHNLIEELRMYKGVVSDKNIRTIFIGGGTPSYIDGKYIKRILEYVKNNFNIKLLEEVTIEINPGTLDLKKANIYKEAGINRVSIGVQTLNDSHLKNIGRIHTEDEFYQSYEILKSVGFTNINLDFIFGLPDENISHVQANLKKIELLNPSHISYYGLILEEGTYLNKLDKQGKLNLPTDNEEREMYYLIKKKLKDMGYIHYEISNFSLAEKECKHNLIYWHIEAYIGVGLSSHSFINKRRYWNRDNFSGYFNDIENHNLPIEEGEDISKKTEISEFAIMNLRLIKGIDKKFFKERFERDIEYFYRDAIKRHLEDGLLEENDRYLRLSDRGLDLSNRVELDFLL